MEVGLCMQDEHKHRGVSTDTEVVSWCASLFSQLRALCGARSRRMKSRQRVSEGSCAYGGMCSGEKDHREQKAFHTHYRYVSSSWKAKESQVEGMTASDPVKREARY